MKKLLFGLLTIGSLSSFAGVCTYQIQDKDNYSFILHTSKRNINFDAGLMSDLAACGICKSYYLSIPRDQRSGEINYYSGAHKSSVNRYNLKEHKAKVLVEKDGRTVFCSHINKNYEFNASLKR